MSDGELRYVIRVSTGTALAGVRAFGVSLGGLGVAVNLAVRAFTLLYAKVENTLEEFRKQREEADKLSASIGKLAQTRLERLVREARELRNMLREASAASREVGKAANDADLAQIDLEKANLRLSLARGEIPAEDAEKKGRELDFRREQVAINGRIADAAAEKRLLQEQRKAMGDPAAALAALQEKIKGLEFDAKNLAGPEREGKIGELKAAKAALPEAQARAHEASVLDQRLAAVAERIAALAIAKQTTLANRDAKNAEAEAEKAGKLDAEWAEIERKSEEATQEYRRAMAADAKKRAKAQETALPQKTADAWARLGAFAGGTSATDAIQREQNGHLKAIERCVQLMARKGKTVAAVTL
jgi:hypothetical protein